MVFQFSYHPETVLPLSILQCWDQLLTDIRYEINMHIRSDGQKKEHIGDVALSTDDLISITIFILLKSLWSCGVVRRRNLSSSLPAHFALIDSFTPCELSCSVLGYAYGITETAMTWILKNGKQWLVCSLYVVKGVLEERGQKKRERAPMSVNEGMSESKLDCFTSVACWNPWGKNTSVREGMSSLHG